MHQSLRSTVCTPDHEGGAAQSPLGRSRSQGANCDTPTARRWRTPTECEFDMVVPRVELTKKNTKTAVDQEFAETISRSTTFEDACKESALAELEGGLVQTLPSITRNV